MSGITHLQWSWKKEVLKKFLSLEDFARNMIQYFIQLIIMIMYGVTNSKSFCFFTGHFVGLLPQKL